MDILERIDGLEAKFHEVSLLITDPSVIADQARYVRLNREYRDLERVLESAEKYKKAVTNLTEAKEIFYNESDADLREMARAEIDELEPQIPALEEEVKWHDMLLRHTVWSVDIVPKSDKYYLTLSYNHRRQREMALSGVRSLAGFAMGAGVKLYKFRLGFAMSQYTKSNFTYQVSLSTDINQFLK